MIKFNGLTGFESVLEVVLVIAMLAAGSLAGWCVIELLIWLFS